MVPLEHVGQLAFMQTCRASLWYVLCVVMQGAWAHLYPVPTSIPPGLSSRKSNCPLNMSPVGLAPTPTTTMSLAIFLPLFKTVVVT